MHIIERAQKVIAEIDAALALAAWATPGPWTAEDNWVGKDHSTVAGTHHLFDVADATFIAASRNGWPVSLRCLKAAIEGLLEITDYVCDGGGIGCSNVVTAETTLTTICSQWEAQNS